MNERIRRLMEQAVTSIDGQTFGKTYIPDAFTEKFAELIVRECAELCDRFQARDVGMQPAECAGAISKMFGVKE